MNKRGSGEAVLGWLLLAVFVAVAVCGFLSHSLCDKLLIVVAVCGLFWLFFGSTLLIKTEAAGFIFFLFITLILLIIWTILRGSGLCDSLGEMLRAVQ